MKITHRDGDYVKQHHKIKRNSILRAQIKNLLLIGETSYDEYTLSDNDVGYVTDLDDPSANRFTMMNLM